MTPELTQALRALKLLAPILANADELAVTRSGHFEVRVRDSWCLLQWNRGKVRVPVVERKSNGRQRKGTAVVVMPLPSPACANGASVTIDCTTERLHERALVALLGANRSCYALKT